MTIYGIGSDIVDIDRIKKLLKNKNSTIFAILDGSISDNKGRNVLSYGDIIKTDDLRILSKVFKIKKKLSVVRVY